ncbi:MAG: hypothetical protein KGI75_04085 [Rhizobiaceae bacterium]|nr:hypothetical protein [Rhizobiaceae bacterium]
MTVISAIIASERIILTEGVTNKDGTITVIKDETFDLDRGDRQLAYVVMHKRLNDRFSQGIDLVLVMANGASQNAATSAMLGAAELRGVLLSAVPAGVAVKRLHRHSLSRNFGARKVADYTRDDTFFEEHFRGAALRKGSREAAFLLLSAEW